MSFVEIRIRDQEKKCADMVGGLATCMWPRKYFFEAGIFEETGCFFEHVIAANCSGNPHLEAFVPDTPEAADVYRTMSKLTRIDVSGVPQLRAVPRSWSLIPNLKVLDVEGSTLFAGLPYALCAKMSIEHMHLDGTMAQKALDWSGQLKQVIGAGMKPDLSPACEMALTQRALLRELVLSDNNISLGTRGRQNIDNCDDDVPGFRNNVSSADASEIGFIKKLTEISRLVLSDNQIGELSQSYFDVTEYVDRNGGRVELAGNPIRVAMLFAMRDRASSIMGSLRDNPLSGMLQCFQADGSLSGVLDSAFFDGWSGLIDIRLVGNNLTSLDPQIFSGLSSLQFLSLVYNQLTSLDPQTFSELSSLRYLSLDNNQLTSLDPQTFSGLSSLRYLWILSGNDNLNRSQVATWGLDESVVAVS